MAGEIPYVRWAGPAYGVAETVSPLIRRVTARNPGPFTYTGTGTYIVGHGDVAVIDPGPDDQAHLDALIAALQGERVAAILVTHTHADHSPLSAALARRTGAPILAAEPPPAAVSSGPDSSAVGEEGLDLGFRPDRLIGDGDEISAAGWTIRCVATPGHASNHLAFALEEENALFSGDHVMGWSTTVISPPSGDMGDYYASLRKVMAKRFATLWPTHGAPVTDPAPFLQAYLDHRLERERQVLDRLGRGDTTIAGMVPHIYAMVDPRLWPAASHSMLAHLIDLVQRGVVSCDGRPEIGSSYRLT